MLAHTTRTHTQATMALLTAMLLLILPAGAFAQVKDVEPYFIAVTADEAFLRSGDLRSYYPITTLRAGAILRVTGESGNWLRVEYPKGLLALVRADHATLDQAAGVVTLSRSGALKALSDTRYGVDGSFRDVQGPPTPATTRLKHHRTETSNRGVVFFVVDAPKGAAGFIEAAQTRRAVPSEVQAHLASIRDDASEQRPATRPSEQPRTPAQTPPQNPDTTPETRQGDRPTLMEPMRIEPAEPTTPQPTTRPSQEPATQPTPQPRDGAQPRELEIRTQPDARPADPTKTALDPLPSLEALSAAFDAVRRQGDLDAEVDELVAAFERVLSATPDIEENASTRTWLRQRLGLLELRQNLQDNMRKAAQARARLEAQGQQSQMAMARLQDLAIYDFVGKLEKSAVYNGDRLPLMYRLVSVGEGIPRTLGYVQPGEGLELERKLGSMVGVTGSATQRADLRLSTINAQSVVVLRSEADGNVRYATEPQN